MWRLCGSVAPKGRTATSHFWPRMKSWVCAANSHSRMLHRLPQELLKLPDSLGILKQYAIARQDFGSHRVAKVAVGAQPQRDLDILLRAVSHAIVHAHLLVQRRRNPPAQKQG